MCDKCRYFRRPLPEGAPRTALVQVPQLTLTHTGVPQAFHGKRLIERPHWVVAAVASRDGGEIIWVSEPVSDRIRSTQYGIKAVSATTGVMREIAYSPDTGWRNVWVAELAGPRVPLNIHAASSAAYRNTFEHTYNSLFDKTPEPKLYAVVAVASLGNKALADLDPIRRYSVHPKLALEAVQGIAERRSRHHPNYTFAVVEVLGTITTETKATTTKSWEK